MIISSHPAMKSAIESKLFSPKKTLNIHGRLLDLSIPKVMGVLNVTPDSFYDGGRYTSDDLIISQAEKMVEDGATFIDVGGYSSRPGAADITVKEELDRVIKVIALIIRKFPQALISVDTFRSDVAKAAIGEGACIVNDISAGELDPQMFEVVSSLNVPYIAMHMRGNPANMSTMSTYENLLKDIVDYFHKKNDLLLHQYGIKDVVIDPGFGFAKTIAQNFEILNHLNYFEILEKPLMVGLSRKSMIWKTLNISPEEALNGTTSLNTIALLNGASILRVHDVKQAVETIDLYCQLKAITRI